MDGEGVEIRVPDTLYRRILEVSKELGVKDIQEFIVDLIRDSLSRVESELSREEYSPEEIKRIKDRLRSLGYL